jgi:threonine dehydrogenase-like Zn-dependent dehydrogenase
MGHEFLGTVVEAGAACAAGGPARGSSARSARCCGACYFCRRGLPSRCEHGQLFGWVEHGRGLHGGQAELVRVPLADATLVAVPAGVARGAGAARGRRALARAVPLRRERRRRSRRPRWSCSAAGPVGLAAVLGARTSARARSARSTPCPSAWSSPTRFGARALDLAARRRARARARARRTGAARTWCSRPWAARRRARSPTSSCARRDDLRAGRAQRARLRDHAGPALRQEPDLPRRACPGARLHGARAGDAWRARELDLAAFFSHRLPLAEGAHGYALFEQKRESCTKVLLVP